LITDPDLKNWYKEDKKHRKKELLKVFDVEYAHLSLSNDDDLYVTKYGIHCLENLKPHNHCKDTKWFDENSKKLSGTSSVFRVRTKKVNGKYKDIVIKWNRMGQDIPGGYETEELMYASFNSPFEEFSLVMELREEYENRKRQINIQKPLAIYVPSERVELSRTGRKEYYMDALIWKRVDESSGGGALNVLKFIYHGDNVAAEFNGDGIMLANYLFAPGVDEPLMVERAGESYYYHQDNLHSVIFITDADGDVVNEYTYDSFGNIRRADCPGMALSSPKLCIPNRYAFTGREWEPEIEMYHYRRRTYNPDAGVFTSEDKAVIYTGDTQSLNRYSYVNNNPLNYVDPSGLDKSCPTNCRGCFSECFWDWGNNSPECKSCMCERCRCTGNSSCVDRYCDGSSSGEEDVISCINNCGIKFNIDNATKGPKPKNWLKYEKCKKECMEKSDLY